MELKDQVCTTEQGEKLEKLGVVAEAYLFFVYFTTTDQQNNNYEILPRNTVHVGYCINAYSVAELMEMLPKDIVKLGNDGITCRLTHYFNDTQFCSDFMIKDSCESFIAFNSKLQAHAVADCLIWLIENDHLKPEEITL